MAVAEFVNIDASESFSGTREATRLRLTAEEARNIRYVLCEWKGECSASSSAAHLEQLAARPDLLEASRSPGASQSRFEHAVIKVGKKDRKTAAKRAKQAEDDDTIAVSPTRGSSYHGWEMLPADRWVDDRTGRGRKRRSDVLHAWRALKHLSERFSPSLVILNALYGDLPPGLPMCGLWGRSTDLEYVRVVRYVEGSGGSGAALESLLHVDKRHRDNESPEAYKSRLLAAAAARSALLMELGKGCERLIVRAAVDYREAWKATS